MSRQSRFDARYWMLGAGALGRPRGMVWGGRRVQDGEHMRNKGIKKKENNNRHHLLYFGCMIISFNKKILLKKKKLKYKTFK